jgi:protein-glutamine gamma-glutamyltransferase
MKTPRFLMAAALLFWGWENGLLVWGALLAVVLEASRFSRVRWEFSNADLNRIADLCWALFVGAMLLLYSTQDRTIFIFKFVQWLPFCFFPLVLAQAYGNREVMPLSCFWWLLRRASAGPAARKAYNISFCYFALCLLAISASTRPDRFFYPGVTLLVTGALISARPRRVSVYLWIGLLLLAAFGGQFSHQQLRRMQGAMEGALGAWFADLFRSQTDPRECPTKIGQPGQIALSGKIILRIHAAPGAVVPPLLRETVWDAYKKESWLASNNEPSMVHMGTSDSASLLPTNTLSSTVELSRYYDGGAGALALPQGTFQLNDVPAVLKTNRLGVVTMESGPGLLDFRASFGPGPSLDGPPSDRDLVVPEAEQPVLSNIVAQLKMEKMTESQKIRAIERFFRTGFTYSLNPPRRRDPTWLGYFLTKSRAGHCEYFATATVLLLREAGINARYVAGFAVPESARHGDTYLVRARHAHAWALAYRSETGGQPPFWEPIDTTPADWGALEAAGPQWWEPISDAMSNLYYQFSKWRWNKTSYAHYTSWLLVPLIVYLLARIIWSQRRQKITGGSAGAEARAPWPGLDSELFVINRELAATQLSRLPNEPLRSWQERLELAFPDSIRLRRIFHLHRALRFDPRGLQPTDRDALRSEAREWLVEFTAQAKAQRQASAHAPVPG